MKQLRGFPNLTGYYIRFVRNYGSIGKPLTELPRKDSFAWTTRATQAFERLKDALTSAPVLALLDFTQPFEIETYASSKGMGAVLLQSGHSIAYIRKPLADQHKGLSTYEKELLAILLAIKKWGHYLKGKPFVIHIDHRSLKHFAQAEAPHDTPACLAHQTAGICL